MGRSSFTSDEIEELRRLVREKQTADRSRQKTLRARMRAIGFYISDFAADSAGFVVSDLDDLISRGVITVTDGGSRRSTSPSRPAAKAAPVGRERHVRPAPRVDRAAPTPTAAAREGGDLDSVVHEALRALAAEHAQPIAKAAEHVPRRPGLYAIHAGPKVWLELALGEPPDERPLYLGKAEASLVSRDLDTHLGDGRTGSSTVRRSFAAMLREQLGLEGRPRNPAKPERPSNYGLSPAHDRKLTGWMRDKLSLATWPKPNNCPFALVDIEHGLLLMLKPPLNLAGVVTPWTSTVKAARKVMADQARPDLP